MKVKEQLTDADICEKLSAVQESLTNAMATLNEIAALVGQPQVKVEEPKELSLDELRSALIPIINESDSNGAQIQEILHKYGVEKISALAAENRQSFLDEVNQQCQVIPF